MIRRLGFLYLCSIHYKRFSVILYLSAQVSQKIGHNIHVPQIRHALYNRHSIHQKRRCNYRKHGILCAAYSYRPLERLALLHNYICHEFHSFQIRIFLYKTVPYCCTLIITYSYLVYHIIINIKMIFTHFLVSCHSPETISSARCFSILASRYLPSSMLTILNVGTAKSIPSIPKNPPPISMDRII